MIICRRSLQQRLIEEREALVAEVTCLQERLEVTNQRLADAEARLVNDEIESTTQYETAFPTSDHAVAAEETVQEYNDDKDDEGQVCTVQARPWAGRINLN